MLTAAIFAACAWGFMLFFWGGFWRADQRLPRAVPTDDTFSAWPEVVAVIPARNEAASIGAVVDAHARTDYPGPFKLIVVDDGSDDGTGALARAAAEGAGGGAMVEVMAAPPLPKGWSGKLAALHAGLARAAEHAPSAAYVLLTDADIRHAPDTLRRLVAQAERLDLALVSLMARLDASGFWGALLTPAFVFFFQKLYPFPWVNRPGLFIAGAAGGCVLVRRDALDQIGGLSPIRDALIDDCALAAAIKRGPPARAIWLGLADQEVVSLRDNRALTTIWKMVARTAFTQLRRSVLLLVLTVIGMAGLYLAPPLAAAIGLFGGEFGLLVAGAAGWLAMAIAYGPTLRLYGQPVLRAAALPAAAALYTAMTIDSARQHWRGKGAAWKGRTYA